MLRSPIAVSSGLVALVLCLPAWGQVPVEAKPKSAAARPAAPVNDPVLATVRGEAIKRSEAERLLSQFSVPPGSEQKAYDSAMELLVNTKLLAQFLKGQRLVVTPQEVDEVVAQYDTAARAEKKSLADELAANNTSLDEFKDRITRTLQWKKFVLARGTDAELKKYADTNKDVFSRTQVRASHILIRLEPAASAEEKEKARLKLLEIKKQIEAGQLSFADAANKHSEDPGNQQTPAGGDLNFFPRKGQFIEPFAAAAFALPKGTISEPVETEYGLHLIQVTDRREGEPIDVAQVKDQVLAQYASDLQEQVVAEERKKAEAEKGIVIQPMPAGLIKPAVPAAPSPSAAPAAGGAAPKAP